MGVSVGKIFVKSQYYCNFTKQSLWQTESEISRFLLESLALLCILILGQLR